ncbi:NUDIX hydrolase [Halopiger djelfimassiliensis]|uniref:NUDIX hydrolase n=1 Tax=Halopiger djelfimassiliensis TaxID=1293047 RepID=UPI000678210F|nr:NUDIX hydrolase [Halopiger djelfimassiliensis]
MTTNPTDETGEPSAIDAITDLETLRARSDVPVHEEINVVDRETVETVAELNNMAVTGVSDDTGAILLMRVTGTCGLKPPSASVAPGDDYAAAAREWVETQAGFEIDLDAVEGVWDHKVRPEDGDRTARRSFVVFSATPVTDPSDAEPEADDTGWYDELPAEAVEPPGWQAFFD